VAAFTGRAVPYEIRHVPAPIRHRDRVIGQRAPVLKGMKRVTFKRMDAGLAGKPTAALVAAGASAAYSWWTYC